MTLSEAFAFRFPISRNPDVFDPLPKPSLISLISMSNGR